MADFATEMGLESVVIFALPDEFGKGLTSVFKRAFDTRTRKVIQTFDVPSGDPAALAPWLASLGRYLAGESRRLALPLDVRGSQFQRRVWRAIAAIPFGETRSYGVQAAAIGRPTAVRAVAGANGDNPIAILVPCHRVIGADGSLTGYGGGLRRKEYLLDLEKGVSQAELALDVD